MPNLSSRPAFELVTAANFMDIKPLLDLTCLAVSISNQSACVMDHSLAVARVNGYISSLFLFFFSFLRQFQGKTKPA
jgi:hypothetical protein